MALRDVDPDRPPRHVRGAAKKVGEAAKRGKVVGIDRKPLRSGQRAKTPKEKREPIEFSVADEPKEVADRMISAGKLDGLSHLKRAVIAYLFTPQERVGRDGMAAASRFQRKLHPIARVKYDFLIVFSSPIWHRLTAKQRSALVYHELLHCGSDSEGKFRMEPHDLEEFSAVVKNFGIWNERVGHMAVQMALWDVAVGDVAGAAVPAEKDERSYGMRRTDRLREMTDGKEE